MARINRTILSVGASAGAGHQQAAHNIANALLAVQPDLSVKEVDIFDYSSVLVRATLGVLWRFVSVRLPAAYSYFHRWWTESYRPPRFCSHFLIRRTARNLVARLGGDVHTFIATHPYAAVVGSEVKLLTGCQLYVVATDYLLNSYQVLPAVDAIFAPSGCQLMTRAPIPRDKWIPSGLPISQAFFASKNQKSIKQRLGLSDNLSTVLVTFGGSGLKGERHKRVCARLLDSGLPLQFIVLTGTNDTFFRKMSCIYEQKKYRRKVKVFGYRDDVSDLYAVADLVIGKAGGLSISEAAVARVPLLVVDALPGQEEQNLRTMTALGTCRKIRNFKHLRESISYFLQHPETYFPSDLIIENGGSMFIAEEIVHLYRDTMEVVGITHGEHPPVLVEADCS